MSGLSQLTQTFGGTGGFSGSCGGPPQGGYGGYGGGPGGQAGGGQHGAPAWIHDRDVHNLIENVSKGSDKAHKEKLLALKIGFSFRNIFAITLFRAINSKQQHQ